jgi:hypothetical protein
VRRTEGVNRLFAGFYLKKLFSVGNEKFMLLKTTKNIIKLFGNERYATCLPKSKGKDDGKVQLSCTFFLTKHHSMKAYCGSGVIAPRVL